MCSNLRARDDEPLDRTSVWPKSKLTVRRLGGELDLQESASCCTKYSGCKVAAYGLRKLVEHGDGPKHREQRGRMFFKREDLIEWMDGWEYDPPLGIGLTKPGHIDRYDRTPMYLRGISPRYFCRVRNGKPDVKA